MSSHIEGKTIRRKIRLTFQQLLSSVVLVSRDMIPIGPTRIRFRERRLIISADGLAVEPDSETERVFPTDSAQRRKKWYQIQMLWQKPYAGRPIGGLLSLSSSKLWVDPTDSSVQLNIWIAHMNPMVFYDLHMLSVRTLSQEWAWLALARAWPALQP